MTAREWVVQVHVLLSCGATLAWLAALAARRLGWRRRHAGIGRAFVGLVVASSALAAGLAAASGNLFGVVFALQPLVLALSAAAQFGRTHGPRRALGALGLVVAVGVLAGFARFLATREFIDVAAFAATAVVVGALALGDLLDAEQPAWQAHSHRMLAAGWFYVAELLIFVLDPHPSLIAWALAAVLPLVVVRHLSRRPVGFGVPAPRLAGSDG